MLFYTRRERRFWILSVAWLLVLYGSLSVARPLSDLLRARGLLRGAVAAAFLCAFAGILAWALRRRPGWRELCLLAGFAGFYVFAVLRLERVEERLHFLEYGLLGGLVYAALLERRGVAPPSGPGWTAPPGALAVGMAAVVGWGDEAIQGLLPDRVYDLRDVAFNTLAAALAVGAMAALRRAGSAAAPPVVGGSDG